MFITLYQSKYVKILISKTELLSIEEPASHCY